MIYVLSVEMLGSLKKALELWDADNCGEGDQKYAMRDALAAQKQETYLQTQTCTATGTVAKIGKKKGCSNFS